MSLLALVLVVALQSAAPAPAAPATPATSSSVDAAIAALGSFDFAARTEAGRTLRRLPPAEAAAALRAAAEHHDDEYVRFRAFVLLTGIDDTAAREVARAVLADRNDRLRTVAYQWFEHHPDPATLPALLEALPRETSEFVRPALTRAIAAHGDDPRAQAALEPLVLDGEDFFRGSVITAIGDYHGTFAVDEIRSVAALDGPLQDDAVTALGRLGDRAALPDLAKLQEAAPREIQPSVSAALCLLGLDCDARLAYLKQTLEFATANDGHQPLLRAAVHALGVLATAGHPDALAALFAAAAGAPERARAPIALGIGLVALRDADLILDVVQQSPAPEAPVALLLEAFDMLEEDFEEERFYSQVRRAFWSAPEGSPRRAAAERIIQQLEF